MKCCKYEFLKSDEFIYSSLRPPQPVRVNYGHIYGYAVNETPSGYSLDIQHFIIANSIITKIPANLFRNLNELLRLDILNSSVKTISVTDFFGANQLTHLNLTKNGIQSLEPKLFVHVPNLLILDLSHNDLTNVSEYAFDHLDKLNTLILSHNKLMKFETNQRFTNLKLFSINDNLLNVIAPTLFQHSVQLRDVNLKNNNLHIDHLILPSNVTLDNFDISNNLLASISISTKQISIRSTNTSSYLVHRNVNVLDASNNQISSVAFESSAQLTNINLSNNRLTSMINVTHSNNLQQLDLSYNSIKDFAISSFSEMNDLHVLNLKKSGLTSLDFGIFSQQTKLISLDISDNNLKEIDFDMFLFMSSLSVLYIDGNELTNVDVSDLKNILPNLTTISISRNLFQCHDLISVMKTLNSLRINFYTAGDDDDDDGNVVKNTTNVRGIKCFSNANGKRTAFVELSNNFTSQTNNELLELKHSLETLKNQFEKRFHEQFENLSSLNEKFISFSNRNSSIHGNIEADPFQFAFTFLLMLLILLVFGFSIFLYCKFRATRRWYTAAKQNSISGAADQTLV